MAGEVEPLGSGTRTSISRRWPGGGGGGPAPPLRMPGLALVWACLLLAALRPAAGSDQPSPLAVAAAVSAGSPARRLQQACPPWPLYFENLNCSGTAAITVRAQLAAPPGPGEAPCINGAARSGEWCTRSLELAAGQQQLVFPQAANTTFQYYATVQLPSSVTVEFGGNQTDPQTAWFDTASGQPCSLLQPGNATTCRPFRQVNAVQGNATCPDPGDGRPYSITCKKNSTCSAKLLVNNNCSLNIGLLVYGELATDVQPGYCYNNVTRRGEACLRYLTYPAGQADMGDTYAIEGLQQAGLHYYAWIYRTTYMWGNDSTSDAGVWFSLATGQRCAGPGESCVSFRQVPLNSTACGSTASLDLSCPGTCDMPQCKKPLAQDGYCSCLQCDNDLLMLDDFQCKSHVVMLQRLLGCEGVPYDELNAAVGDPACANWTIKTYAVEPCPTACNFQALPSQCRSSIALWMLAISKGLALSNATLPAFVDAVSSACAAGQPVSSELLTAVASEELSSFESCGPDAPAAVAASGSCQLTQLAGLFLDGSDAQCDPACAGLLNSVTVDCYVAYSSGALAQIQGGQTYASVLRRVAESGVAACEGQAAPPALPSTLPAPPPAPSQPNVDTSSSAPIGAIAGGAVGAVAAVAVCVALGLALRRRRQQRRQLQRAGSAVAKEVDEIDEFVVDGFGSSKAASSQQPSLASSHTLGSDPLVSYIYASQLGGKISQRSSGSAGRSQGGSSGTGVHTWEMGWADLQLQRVVGAGSFGRVYLASWGTVTVAVKVLLVPGAAGTDLAAPGAAAEALALPPSTLAELEAEAALLASLRHPCCVNFFGVTRNPPALVTEYCGRGSVAELLDRARASPAVAAELTWRRRLLIALGAADGMAYLHGHKPAPIIHRDLKSPNLLVTDAWQTKVADFGLSRVLEDSEMASSVAVTNPRWLAPELMRGERATQMSDVFAFGVILWELLTWERPWGATNPWQISAAVLAGRRLEIPNPAALPGPGPGSPEGLAAYLSLMQRCWAQAPGDRPSFAEVVQMVRALLNAQPAESSLEPSRST